MHVHFILHKVPFIRSYYQVIPDTDIPMIGRCFYFSLLPQETLELSNLFKYSQIVLFLIMKVVLCQSFIIFCAYYVLQLEYCIPLLFCCIMYYFQECHETCLYSTWNTMLCEAGVLRCAGLHVRPHLVSLLASRIRICKFC